MKNKAKVLYVEVQIQAGARDMAPYWHSIEESIKKRSSIRSSVPTRKEISHPVETAWNVECPNHNPGTLEEARYCGQSREVWDPCHAQSARWPLPPEYHTKYGHTGHGYARQRPVKR
jgi:hypothetical protein